MKPSPTHQIIRTYLNRHGVLESRATRFVGYTDESALHHFEQHKQHAEDAWAEGRTWNGVPVRTTGLVLIDASENVLAEWTHQPEMEVAA